MTHFDSGNSRIIINNVPYSIRTIFPSAQWGNYRSRLQRYEIFDGYYNNIAYNRLITYAEGLKRDERLYKHIRGVYNPVARLVDLYVSKIFPSSLDTQTATAGAIPIIDSTPELDQAIITLWQASNWNQKKNVFVRNGTRFGDSYIKTVDDVANGRVFMQVVDPRKIKSVLHDATGKVIVIEFEFQLEIDGHWQTVGQIITPESFATTINGNKTAIFENARGEKVSEWDNEYGFVPVTHTMHTDIDRPYGANAFYTQIHKVNELNDLASINNDGARKQANMPLFSFGANTGNLDYGADKSESSSTNKDDTPRKDTKRVLDFPADARVEALPPTIDLMATLANIQELLAELERDMPELSLHRLRGGSNITAPGINAVYNDAVSRIENKQGIYNASLIASHKMAIAIGGMRGYKGYEAFNLMSIESGLLDHNIKSVPIIGDRLSKNEKLMQTSSFLLQSGTPDFVFQEIGWSQDESITLSSSAQSVNPFGFGNDGILDGDDVEADDATIIANDLEDIQ